RVSLFYISWLGIILVTRWCIIARDVPATYRRARRSAREAGYWKRYTTHQTEISVCIQSAINEIVCVIALYELELRLWRIEGTIHLYNTTHTVPSISPH